AADGKIVWYARVGTPGGTRNAGPRSTPCTDGVHVYGLGHDGELVCVALVDILPGAMSAVYSYYEPSLRRRGLGVQAVLSQVEIARSRDMPFLYLGYWIEGNASMRYKARYQPHQLLQGRPGFDEAAQWRPPPVSSR
ncbi:MAG: hypothetical protein AAGF23_07700, partial [Acidobacteriota bacterium]